MKHILLFTAFLSSLVGCNASVLDFEARQVDIRSSDQAVAKTNPLDNSTQPGQVSGEAHNSTAHLEYPKQPTPTLIRKSTSNDGCKGDFNDKDHYKMWDSFKKTWRLSQKIMQTFSLSPTTFPQALSMFVSAWNALAAPIMKYSAVLHTKPGITVFTTDVTIMRYKLKFIQDVAAI
ncbi:hypothetical protein DSO57_1011110 [Entomophthora muscae]|uniref:Uncharacterized protein n=1 Tax=Entomophthora muscae TaxID=34485 RepID=A0ACC2T6H7_9FUNG|nr:hypothetical protein DSO57_1011110 [Entomophthora muscae]